MNDQTFDYASYAKMPLSIRKTMLNLVDNFAPEAGNAAYMMVYEHEADPELRERARLSLERNGIKIGETDRPTEGNPGETHYQVDDPSQEGAKSIPLDGGDGQIRTPAQLADTPNLFVLDEGQGKRLKGEIFHPTRTKLYVILAIAVLWTVGIVAFLVSQVVGILHGSPNLIVVAFVAFIELVMIAAFVTNFRLQRRFETLGRLLQGQMVGATGRWVRHSDTDNHGHRTSTRSFDVTIGYTFRTPDGQKLTSSSTRTRSDLKNQPMPEAGTPVAVLYVDDKTYMLL